MTGQRVRRTCESCGKPLSQYNRAKQCQACVNLYRNTGDQRDQPVERTTPVYPTYSTVYDRVTVVISAESIFEFRRKASLTQQLLADRAGISVALVTKLETAERQTTTIATLRAIASVLRAPVSTLIDPSFKRQLLEEYLSFVENDLDNAGAEIRP